MATTTTTLLAIIQEVATRLDLLEQGTATGGSASTIISTNYPWKNTETNASTKRYLNNYVYITDTTDDAAPINEGKGIITYAPSTGTLTVSSDFSANIHSGDTFDVYKGGVDINDIKAAVNRCLVNLRYVDLQPLTLVVDGDMETSGVGTWTATNATSSKLSSGVWRGTQSLRVLNSAANGYAQSGTIYVVSGQTYILQARVKSVTGTGTLVAYDVTNSAEIDSESSSYQGWNVLYFSFTVPATCEAIAIRLKGTGASDDSYWDDVILLRQSSRGIVLPTWLDTEDDIRYIYQDCQRWYADEDWLRPLRNWRVQHEGINPDQPFRLVLPDTIVNPIWIEAFRPHSELSAVTSTTTCPKELVVLGGMCEILRLLINRYPGAQGQLLRAKLNETVRDFQALQRKLAPGRVLRPHWPYGGNAPYGVI